MLQIALSQIRQGERLYRCQHAIISSRALVDHGLGCHVNVADVNWKPGLRTRCNYWLRHYHCNDAAVCVLFNYLGEEFLDYTFSIAALDGDFPLLRLFFLLQLIVQICHCIEAQYRFNTAGSLFRRLSSFSAKWNSEIAFQSNCTCRFNLSLFQQFPRKPKLTPSLILILFATLDARIRSSNKWKTRIIEIGKASSNDDEKRDFSDIFATASDFPLLACAFSRENLSSSGISAQKMILNGKQFLSGTYLKINWNFITFLCLSIARESACIEAEWNQNCWVSY